MDDELDDRYEDSVPKARHSITFSFTEPVTLADLTKAVEGFDPSEVIISAAFEVPDWVSIEITIKDE